MKSHSSTYQKALRLQKKIFQSLKTEADRLLGPLPESISRYRRETRMDFQDSQCHFNKVDKIDLIASVRSADVTFIADFHTFKQSQKTALRIMKESIQEPDHWSIGLEMISSHYQSELDQFQRGELSVEDFHQRISYLEEWGFPWSHYSLIFEWAKENKIKLIALNRPKPIFRGSENQELEHRDEWAAGIITDFFHDQIQKSIPAQMIVLYGELHVGTQHLPAQLTQISKNFLKSPLNWVTIHQNDDLLFWKIARHNHVLQTEIIKLKNNTYCVFSSTPWAKLQSLMSWLEGCSPDESDPAENDYLSLLQSFGNTITDFLGEPPPSYESMSICTLEQTEIINRLRPQDGFTRNELKLIKFHATANQRLYIPKVSIAYLGSPSLNGVAELAAIHLLKSKTGVKHLFHYTMDDFSRLALEAAFGFFGSLILNPRRKYDLPKDHLKRVKELKKTNRPLFRFEKEARLLGVQALKKDISSIKNLKINIKNKRQGPTILMGAKYLGRILGARLHQAVLSEVVQLEWIRKLFFLPPDSNPSFFEERLRELKTATASIQTHLSKTDQL